MLSKFYQQIQIIMTILGYYDGVCDGVWGPKCIAAKREWEYHDDFDPATPSNGLPFTGRDKLPKGMVYFHKGLTIMWPRMTKEVVDKILSEKGEMITRAAVHAQCGIEEPCEPEPEVKPVAVVSAAPAPVVSTHKVDPIDEKVIVPVVAEEPEDLEEEIEEEEETPPNVGNKDWTQKRRNK